MKILNLSIAIFVGSALSGCSLLTAEPAGHPASLNASASDFEKTQQFYEAAIREDEANIARLNLFFTKMPKGGDIHHHYTGTIYAETYLDWVQSKQWFIDACSLKILKSKQEAQSGCNALTVAELLADNALYRKLLTLWSDKDFDNHFHQQPPPDTSFFNTFSYFGAVSNEYMATGLQILKQRALKENVSYIETMLSRVGAKSSDILSSQQISSFNTALRSATSQQEVDETLKALRKALGEKAAFGDSLQRFLSMVEKVHVGIDDDQFTMRYQTYAARVLDPVQVFTDLYSGHLAASNSELVVGVNIVAPENNHTALADYTLHMRMFNFLSTIFPAVKRALHAGELTLGMVRPKDLLFHISQARSIAYAQRIGHGIDLPYESNVSALLADLKKNAAIEINLTSNEFILGVEKNEHPYLIYASYGVPMVISTDDSGVSRNNLSGEFVLLASRYRPSYSSIKTHVYNSIQYSFLSAADKEKNKQLLDNKFAEFEFEIAALSGIMRSD